MAGHAQTHPKRAHTMPPSARFTFKPTTMIKSEPGVDASPVRGLRAVTVGPGFAPAPPVAPSAVLPSATPSITPSAQRKIKRSRSSSPSLAVAALRARLVRARSVSRARSVARDTSVVPPPSASRLPSASPSPSVARSPSFPPSPSRARSSSLARSTPGFTTRALGARGFSTAPLGDEGFELVGATTPRAASAELRVLMPPPALPTAASSSPSAPQGTPFELFLCARRGNEPSVMRQFNATLQLDDPESDLERFLTVQGKKMIRLQGRHL